MLSGVLTDGGLFTCINKKQNHSPSALTLETAAASQNEGTLQASMLHNTVQIPDEMSLLRCGREDCV